MKKIILATLTALAIAGCSEPNKSAIVEQVDSSSTSSFKKKCIDGVIYYSKYGKYESFLTPAFNQDSTVKICEEQP